MHIKKITEDLDLYSTFWELTQTYEDVCTTKIQSIREKIFGTRTYIDGLYEVFNQLRLSHQYGPVKKTATPIAASHVLVLLTSNRRFSGKITKLVFSQFLEAYRKGGAKVIVIGKIGRHLIGQQSPKIPATCFEVPEEKIAISDLQPILNEINKYQTVDVFYGRFINLVKQLPLQYNLAGDYEALKALAPESRETPTSYIFEPSLPKIQNFFETELLTSFFRQNINESHLANLGSRAMKMEESSVTISERVKILNAALRVATRDYENRKQLNMLPAIFYGNFN
ncbi:MAG: F0F1 ATP synthase subunit gamma [candidate division WWE3 bacterium]|nr:F0F1 ATP synthase subunit gamma [candidate division WWE3 bacterium]